MNFKPVDFIFGLHFHQPVGNFESILENAYKDAYYPLIKTFKKFKNIKMNLHISSPLLEYFRKIHPEFLNEIKEEVENGRIEMMGGGFYEPVLTSIPKRDIEGQIKKMENFLEENFSTHSRGIWLTERVWEPHIPSLLKDTHVEYAALDDTHFIQTGFIPEELRGYYITEDNGNTLGVFIINKTMRYYIPFQPVEKILSLFMEYANSSIRPLICMLDDGEKFGVWPNTKEWVYGKNWLENFFAALQKNSHWLRTHTLSEYFDNNPPLGNAYLPACAYYEMLEWSTPIEGAKKIHNIKEKLKKNNLFKETDPYLTGGIWKNYFSKYPESNYMHKKMLYLSKYLNNSQDKFNDKKLLTKAYNHLYRAQCNCSYWHGVFGGLYLPHLRNAVYENLNKLHFILDKVNHPEGEFISVEQFDINCDKQKEILIDTDKLFLCISPDKGGIIEEISDKYTHFNHLNTVSRREELYHYEILEKPSSSEEGIVSIHDIAKKDTQEFKSYLLYDNYLRKSLIDHILPETLDLESFRKQEYRQFDTFKLKYSHYLSYDDDKVQVKLQREMDYEEKRLQLSKNITLEKGKREFNIKLIIKNLSQTDLKFKYGMEFNFSMLSDKSSDKFYHFGHAPQAEGQRKELSAIGIEKYISEFGIVDRTREFSINISLNKNCELWYMPVKTVTNSESNFELTYQSSCMIPVFQVELNPEESISLNCNYSIINL